MFFLKLPVVLQILPVLCTFIVGYLCVMQNSSQMMYFSYYDGGETV